MSQCSRFVGAGVGNAAKGLEGLKVADNNVPLDHSLGTGRHGNRQDHHGRGGQRGNAGCNSVNDNLLSSELSLQGGANINTEEPSNSVGES